MNLTKRILAIGLSVLLLFMLGGCATSATEQTEQTKATEVTVQDPYFTGKVLEKYESSCLVEVTDIGSGNLAVGQQVQVHINAPDCPSYEAGDVLIIGFDGKMTCSLPPQVVGVTIVKQNQ